MYQQINKVIPTPPFSFQNIMSKIPTVTHLIYMEGLKRPSVAEFPSNVVVKSFTQVMEIGQKPENGKYIDGESVEIKLCVSNLCANKLSFYA